MKQAKGNEADFSVGRDFWDVMASRYVLSLNITRGALDNIPAKGPLVLLSNHPNGILDGLMMGYIPSCICPDLRILAHRIFSLAPEIEDIILPISFDGTPEPVALKLQTRRDAITHPNGGEWGVNPCPLAVAGAWKDSVNEKGRPLGGLLVPCYRVLRRVLVHFCGAKVTATRRPLGVVA